MAVVKKYRANLTEFKKVLNAQWTGAPLKPIKYSVSGGADSDVTNLILNHLVDINNLVAGESITLTIQAYEVEE